MGIFRRIYPRSIEFCLVYKTKDDLRNILFCCKNHFKSISFRFHPLKILDISLYDFMLETKNSRCWESVVELCLRYCDIEIIYKIVSETYLPNLRHLHLDNFCSRYEDDKYAWSGEKNHSLRQLSLQFTNNVYGDKLLGILFKCFPI